MSEVFALFTSDPNLALCGLWRLQAHTSHGAGAPTNASGLGWFTPDEVLLQRFATGLSLPELGQQWSNPESAALLYQATALPLGLSVEENGQPFRSRHWLFAHSGEFAGFGDIRNRLLLALPDHLRRQIRGPTASEAVFALFLKHLKESGRPDTATLEPAFVAQLLGHTVRVVAQLANDAGVPGKPTLNLVVTNGHLLAAVRYGAEPLSYTLLDGSDRCARCGLEGLASDAGPASAKARLVAQHRRARAIALSSHALPNAGWIELPNESALAVGPSLSLELQPI